MKLMKKEYNILINLIFISSILFGYNQLEYFSKNNQSINFKNYSSKIDTMKSDSLVIVPVRMAFGIRQFP